MNRLWKAESVADAGLATLNSMKSVFCITNDIFKVTMA